jgi:hypothetical protein
LHTTAAEAAMELSATTAKEANTALMIRIESLLTSLRRQIAA